MPCGLVWLIRQNIIFSYSSFGFTLREPKRAESPKVLSPGQAKRRPGLGQANVATPCKVGCSKFALKSCAFFDYGIDAFDHQIWREVFIRPFLNMTVSACLQSFFKFEVNSSVFICQMKT